ncbi:ABC transporter permease [Puia dinghuensis]|uniref:ABC transporter permease n=1 Tax=Puia dinghuensis TaxID=1792502 RepID=A0A8J2XP34_9BACT|nr:ABC transporter permease [Puia dinghuensis]GGA86418.1 ABC transporter permease [Puia dinghuensis]
MFRNLEIIWTSFKMALQEFRSNKLRTFLSLLGITFGIFCIISVLSTISSMQIQVNKDLKALGTKTIYIDKWQYTPGPDYPWWKYIKRPTPKFDELRLLKMKVPDAAHISFEMETQDRVDYGDNSLTGVSYYGNTEDFDKIQQVTVGTGRYFQQADFDHGSPFVVLGYRIAEQLFNKPEKAVGQTVKLRGGKNAIVIGVIEKQGQSLIGGWDYDNCILLTYSFMKQMIKEENANPKILAQAGSKMSTEALQDELKGAMRSIRQLSPTQDDNFSLNNIDNLGKFFDPIFSGMNIGGWAIAVLSLIVGMFGVANIMFVTVRERTGQIGLKKAIGAKQGSILTEFLLESAFLCVIGGLIGLIAVFALTLIFSAILSFRVIIPLNIILLAVSICIFTGVAAGIIPAFVAARMDPVVAIRSN